MITPPDTARSVSGRKHSGCEAPHSLFEIFHANTCYTRANAVRHALRIAEHLSSRKAIEAMSHNFKVYRFARKVPLPASSCRDVTFAEALRQRVSTRTFSGAPLSLQALGNILLPAAACNRVATAKAFPDVQLRFRSYPSGGAEYPLEIYPLLLRAADLPPCVTHFDPRNGVLSVLRSPLHEHELQGALLQGESQLHTAAAFVVITALFARTTEKYGDRGYRLILLEAGHLAQNLCLAAAASGCGSLAWGGFYDQELNALLGVDGVSESVIHCLFLGHRSESA